MDIKLINFNLFSSSENKPIISNPVTMGKDSVYQKRRFLGLDQGPSSMTDVEHLYNFENILDYIKSTKTCTL